MQHKEYDLQKKVCKWLSVQYPKVMFMSDTIASCKLTMGQAMRNKTIQKDGFKTPDLIIFEPKGEYHGLFIELKTESPFLKSIPNTLKKNEHIEAQADSMILLSKAGYKCFFSWSFGQTKEIIDKYLCDHSTIKYQQDKLLCVKCDSILTKI